MIEEELKKMIIEKYGNMAKFADVCGVKYSSLMTIFSRGVKNANVQNVIRICRALGITADGVARGVIEYAPRSATLGSLRREQNRLFNLMLGGLVEIDGVVLTDDELRLVDDMITAAADMIRKRRDRARVWSEDDEE